MHIPQHFPTSGSVRPAGCFFFGVLSVSFPAKNRFMNGCAFNFNPLTFEAAFFGLICGIRLAEPSGGLPVGLIFAPGVAKTPL